MIKQTHPGLLKNIQTDGCYFMVDLSIAEDISQRYSNRHIAMTPIEVITAYRYAVPDYMKNYGDKNENNCYILNHPQVIGIGLHIMGFREFDVKYLYRKDKGAQWFGDDQSILECNYFVKEVITDKQGKTHFVRCDIRGQTLYNPGTTDGNEWWSFRGYKVTVLLR